MKQTTTKIIAIVITIAVLLGSVVLSSVVQARTDLSEELLRLIELVSEAPEPEESDAIPPLEEPDTTTPSFRLRAEIQALEDILTTLSRTSREYSEAFQALTNLQKAESIFKGKVVGLEPTYLEETLDALAATERDLDVAYKVADGDTQLRLIEVQMGLAEIAQQIASGVFDLAMRSGVDEKSLMQAQQSIDQGDMFLAKSQYHVAVVHFGNGLKASLDTIIFDVDLFEANINDALMDEAVGYAYAITLDGVLHSQGGVGLARTSADEPETAQSPTKEMHVASVSKMITTVAVLHLMEEKGVSVDDPISPWLPSGWDQGAGVNQVKFRNLMTHTTGFFYESPQGSGYAALEELIAKGAGLKTFKYQNANFGMFRVIVSKLLDIDPVDYPEFSADVLTSSAFILYVKDLMGSVGVDLDCLPSDANPTLYYRFPYDDSAGKMLGSYELGCGGYGFYISATDLAQLLATMRFSNELLSPESRQMMDEGFLGWNDPVNGYSWADGDVLGAYHSHGGDWHFSPDPKRGLDSCVMNFPITVQVALIINSVGGSYPYQCQVLRNAYDAAWIPSN